MKRPLAFAAAIALAVSALYAILFDVTLPARLPTEADYRTVAAALAAEAQPGDLVLVHPFWADHLRAFVDLPVRGLADPFDEDYVGAGRVWMLGLPRAPRADFSAFQQNVKLATAASGVIAARNFGALSLSRVDVGFGPTQDITVLPLLGEAHPVETREVDGLPRHCLVLEPRVQASVRWQVTTQGAFLHGRVGFIGAHTDWAERPTHLDVRLDGAIISQLDVLPRSEKPFPRWEAPAAPGPHAIELNFSSTDPRPLCLQAWSR